MSNTTPICMSEEYWMNTQLSIARHYGRVKFNDHEYIIVNKDGLDIFACSVKAEKEGREKAIEAGEPADLVRTDFQQFYWKLKRERFIEILKAHPRDDEKKLKEVFKQACKELEATKKEKKQTSPR